MSGTTIKRTRLNRRAIGVSLIVVLIAIPAFLVVRQIQNRRLSAAALAMAKEFEKTNHRDQAIRHLRHYLGTQPNDLAALTLQARLLAELALEHRDPGPILEAAELNDRLLRRLEREGPDRQDARRRLVDLYVHFEDITRSESIRRIAPEMMATKGSRYGVARTIARQVVGDGKTCLPADHRRLAMAAEGLITPGDPESQKEAIDEFKKALEGDPRDAIAADRLARLYADRLHDPNQARNVLDALAKAGPGSIDVFRVRYSFFVEHHDLRQAAAELEEGKRIAPQNPLIRVWACQFALRRGDTVGAKRELDALPPEVQQNYNVRIQRGKIALQEERPEEAIDDWRNSLITVGGTDGDLTFNLADALLQLGQIAEATPLILRFRQIGGENAEPLFRLLQADLNLRLKRPERAKNDLERVESRIKKGPSWEQVRFYLTLGRVHEELWDEEQAMEAYQQANQADPMAPGPRVAMVKLLLNRKPEEAQAEIERGLKSTPDEPALLNALADIQLRRQAQLPPERRSWAVFDQTLKKVAEVTPNSPVLAAFQANRLVLENKLPAAVETLKGAVERSPRSPSTAIKYASGLAGMGQVNEALQALERASAPGAAGDKAAFRIARASLLLAQGKGRDARAVLVRDITKLSRLDRPQVWRALGQIEQSQGNLDAARNAFLEYARLLPGDLQPALDLLALAINSGDEALVRATVEELRPRNDGDDEPAAGDSEDLIWRVCRIQVLLWETRNADRSSASPPDLKLEEARQLLEKILRDAPKMALARLFRGELMERLNQPEKAEEDYQIALKGGIAAALPRLVNLLTRLGKKEALDTLQQSTLPGQFDRLSTLASLKIGDANQAAKSLARLGPEGSQSPASQLWRAQMLERIGKRDDAETLLKTMASRQSSDLDAQLRLIQLQTAHGHKEQVEETIKRVRAEIKTDRPELVEARCRWAAQDPVAADRAFKAALRRWPDEVEVCRFAAAYYDETGQRDEAKTCLERVFKLNPGDRSVARQLALLRMSTATDLDSWKRAWETLGPESSATTEGAEDRLARGVLLASAPDPVRKEEAIARLEALLADLPTDSAVAGATRSYLASLLLKVGRPLRASQLAARSAASDTEPGAIALYVETLIQARKWDEAETQLDRLTAFGPDNRQTAMLRVQLIQAKAGADQAIGALEKAVIDRARAPGAEVFAREVYSLLSTMGPKAAEATDHVGQLTAERQPAASWMAARSRARQGRFAEAIDLCRRSVDDGTRTDRFYSAQLLMEIAVTQAKDATLVSAIEPLLKKALAHQPDSIQLLVLLAMFEHSRGHYDDEVRYYREALKHQPGQAVSLNNLAWVLSEEKHEPSEALTLIDHLVEQTGRNAQALDTRGVILSRLGRHEDAIRDLEESNRLNPLPQTEFHLANTYRAAGREEESRNYRDRIRKAGLKPEQLDPSERATLESMLKP